MQCQKRLPKRSIIGARVSAPWSDGRFYCGTIDSMTEQPNGQFMYSVLFDDGYSKLYFHKDLLGPGFNSLMGTCLKHGQRVFITHQGRELAGIIIKHNRATNEVLVEVECSNGELIETVRKLEDIRLMESRKSARLNSDIEVLRKTTPGIDVPRTRYHRRRKYGDSTVADGQDMDENIDIDSDMQLAAVALQNLSCSPASPHFPLVDMSKSPQSWSERSGYRPSPSPPLPQHFSFSASHNSFFGSVSTDEGIEVEDTIYSMDEDIALKRRKGQSDEDTKANLKFRYKCTWKGCGVVETDCASIEKHIRLVHLGPREDNFSDHEEEFYYEEVELSELDEMTCTMEGMTCASPTQSSPLNLSLPRHQIGKDHDYNRKETLFSHGHQISTPATRPILIPGAVNMPVHQQQTPPGAYIFPQNSPYSRQTFKISPLSPTTSSPKHSTPGRKGRSDIKKCRKVYGMENRDMWCTQCRWKKACTRFVPDGSQ